MNTVSLIQLAIILYCVGIVICLLTLVLTIAWRRPDCTWIDLLKTGYGLLGHAERYVIESRARAIKLLNRVGTGFTLVAMIPLVVIWLR